MEREQRERLAEVMARMANGDRAATFLLYDEFGSPIAAALRRELRRMGVERIEPEDMNGLVVDACIELLGCASAWEPDGGALPWTWARHKLSTLASGFVGQHADPIDETSGRAELEAGEQLQTHGEDDPAELEVLTGLATENEQALLLKEALELVTNPRNQQVFLEYKVQKSLDDPSPAHTVAGRHGLQADNVRQIFKRTRERLQKLAAENEHFSGLIVMALLA